MIEAHDLIDFSPAAAPPRLASVPATFANELLLLALRNEIIGQAGLMAATASILNALEDDTGGNASEEALLVYLPGELTLLPLLLQQLVAGGVPAGVITGIQDLHVRICHGRTAAQAFARCPAQLVFKGGVHLETLAATWRNVCRRALSVLQFLEKHNSGADMTGSMSLERIAPVLRHAGNGGAPCLNDDGSVNVPGLTERRRQKRYTVRWPALATFAHVELEVDVVDLSFGGVGIDCDIVPAVGTEGYLSFEGGETLSGTVVWGGSQKFGFKFDSPLSPGDRLVQLARRT